MDHLKNKFPFITNPKFIGGAAVGCLLIISTGLYLGLRNSNQPESPATNTTTTLTTNILDDKDFVERLQNHTTLEMTENDVAFAERLLALPEETRSEIVSRNLISSEVLEAHLETARKLTTKASKENLDAIKAKAVRY